MGTQCADARVRKSSGKELENARKATKRVFVRDEKRNAEKVVKREVVVDRRGLEPRTLGLRVPCSTN